MLTNKRSSIRTKLILIYLLIALPLVAILAVSFYNRYQSDRQSAINDRIDIARLSASNFSLFIDQVIINEVAIGTSIVDHRLTPEQASRFLARAAERQPASNLAFINENGVITAASLAQTIGQNTSNQPPIRAIMDGQESAIGNLRRNADGAPGFIIAAGIRRDGSLVGIVRMSVNANRIGEVLDIAVRRGGVNIVDSRGRLIFQSQRTMIPFSQRDWSKEQFVKVALSGRTFTSTGLTFPVDNSFRMGAEIPIKSVGWATGSFVPVEAVLAPIQRDALLSLLIALLVLAIALFFAFILGNRLVGNLITLKNRMKAAPQTGFAERVAMKTGDEIEDLADSFNQMQEEILTSQAEQQRLREEVEERNRELSILYEQQKNVASVLQKSLLPVIAPRIDHLEIGLEFQSATEAALVGGDFFDFIELPDNTFGIVIGDVSGKGIEAATLTATVRNTLRAFAYGEKSPAEIVKRVNEVTFIETPLSIFVTLFFGIFDADTYNLVYVNAGHWPPTVFTPGEGIFVNLATGDLPLGAFANATYTEYSIKITPGSLITLFTDGVIEARTDNEFFGVGRLQEIVKEHTALQPGEIAKIVIEQTKAFGGGKLRDDAAVMVIKVII